jgi:hypothetical protein
LLDNNTNKNPKVNNCIDEHVLYAEWNIVRANKEKNIVGTLQDFKLEKNY